MLEHRLIDKINELNWRIEVKTKLNKAEKFVKRLIANAPFRIESSFDMHYHVYSQCTIHLNLESGFADIPNKRMPNEYELAINKFAPNK